MRWLYQLQTRVSFSGPEATAALVLLGALGAGLVVQQVRSASDPVPADFYAAADQAFVDATEAGAEAAAPPERTAEAAPLPTDPPDDASAAVLAEAEVAAAAAPRRTSKPPPARTNLNTASAADLQRLPGIGPALAGRIVAYREANGPFRAPSEITGVKGIGERTFEKLAPWVHL